jgi:RHS repeat-associated protein
VPTAEFDATGAVTQRLTDDAFGRVTRNTNPGFQPFGYAGGLTDAATGLVRFGARDYDPTTGRWTAKDRLRFAGGSANMYSYVDADPVNYSDVNGLCRDKNGQPRACIVEWSTADQHNPNVDPRVLEAAQDIADIADVDLQLSSGLRVGDSGNHGRGLALDINAINGIDIGSDEDLLAANATVGEMAAYIGADSLGFLSIEGLAAAVMRETGDEGQERFHRAHCYGCFHKQGYPYSARSAFEKRVPAAVG